MINGLRKVNTSVHLKRTKGLLLRIMAQAVTEITKSNIISLIT